MTPGDVIGSASTSAGPEASAHPAEIGAVVGNPAGESGPPPAAGSRPANEKAPVLEPGATPPAAVDEPCAALHIQATFRLLRMGGLAPDEAANLTAFLVGLEIHDSPWTIGQINRMLFLRQLYRGEGWGEAERLGANRRLRPIDPDR